MDDQEAVRGSTVSHDPIARESVSIEQQSVAPRSLDDDVDDIAPVADSLSEETQTVQQVRSSQDVQRLGEPQESRPTQQAKAVKGSALPLLRYRKTSVWLLACYLPFLILPWVLTCILTFRPPNLPSYYNQRGVSGKLYLVMLFWMGFVRVLNAIGNIMVVPVTSALLAQGAVVYTQRRKANQKLSLRQTFALSDRGWADILILWRAKWGDGSGSKYLWLAAGLLTLSVVQPPIQQALVTTEIITVMTALDNPLLASFLRAGPKATIIGYDPEPKALAYTPQSIVVADTIKSLATVSDVTNQLHMWHDPSSNWHSIDFSNNEQSNDFFYHYQVFPGSGYFVSALANNTGTGILRQHAMRLNSSVECTIIDESEYPATCSGANPLIQSYTSQATPIFIDPKAFYANGNFTVDICVPGDSHESPWTLSRDRQDISEDIFIKVHVPYATYVEWSYYGGIDKASNFTVQCTANTTRGYFELPSIRNGLTAGPLLDKWPDNVTLWNDYNDYYNTWLGFEYGLVPNTTDHYPGYDPLLLGNWHLPMDPFDRGQMPTPGPLMTSALAMFGKDSFFYVAANASGATYPYQSQQICQAGNIPYSRLDIWSDGLYSSLFEACRSINDPWNEEHVIENHVLDAGLYQWLAAFSTLKNPYVGIDTSVYANEAFEIALFFANEAWLTETAAAFPTGLTRQISTSPGLPVYRPLLPLGGKILISVLIALQIFGLLVLAWYIYTVPTWNEKLDSYAVAQLARSVGDEDVFAPIGKPTDRQLRKLKDVDGLVGIANEDHCEKDGDEQEADSHDASMNESVAMAPTNGHEVSAKAELAPVSGSDDMKLARGGSGFIHRRHAPPKKARTRRVKPWMTLSRQVDLERGRTAPT